MPSVFGRQDDIVGNSIPGFSKDYNFGSGSVLSGNVEFPDYSRSSAEENRRVNRNLVKWEEVVGAMGEYVGGCRSRSEHKLHVLAAILRDWYM